MTTAHRDHVGVIPEWTLGWRLQRALAHSGMSVEQMARDLGVTRTTISRWLHDRGTPRLVYIRQWALMTGVPLGWLVAGDEPVAAPDGGDERRAGVARINRGLYELPGRRIVGRSGRAA